MSGQGDFWRDVDKRAKKTNSAPVSVGVVASLKPFSINYNGLDVTNFSINKSNNLFNQSLKLNNNNLNTKNTNNNLIDIDLSY